MCPQKLHERLYRLDITWLVYIFNQKESKSFVCSTKLEAGGQAVAPPTRKTRSCKCFLSFLIIILTATGAILAWYFLGKEELLITMKLCTDIRVTQRMNPTGFGENLPQKPTGWIWMKFGSDIHVSLGMKCNKFKDILVNTLVHD